MGSMTLALTIYDRTPEVIKAVFAALSFPGNKPDTIIVCYDRAPSESIDTFQLECFMLDVELREAFLDDDAVGPRCPSKAWNMALALSDESNVFCMSSEMILAPHSIGMAYHLSSECPDDLIVGRAEHCGQSYAWAYQMKDIEVTGRTITSSYYPSPFGFSWLMPMKRFRNIGGFDEIFMKGLCYEDSDFVIRLWRTGSNFIFCDDIMGFHLEHKRDHLKNEDGRVTINEQIFKKRYGDINYLKDKKFNPIAFDFKVGMSVWMHNKKEDLLKSLFIKQKLYGQDEPWRAIPVEIK